MTHDQEGTGDAQTPDIKNSSQLSLKNKTAIDENVAIISTPFKLKNQVSDKYPELEKLFKVGKTCGNGGFSKVKMAYDLEKGEKFAIKIVDKEKVGTELPRIDLEIETWKQLSHPHICKLHNVIYCARNIFMIMEFCPLDLYEYIVKQEDNLPINEGRRIFMQLFSAVVYLHTNGISHRDLKPENVLLDNNTDVKLTDFGLCAVPGKSKINRANLRTLCGSPAYCAPELLKGPPYSGSKIDVWSLGVILFVLIVGSLPFYSKTLKDLYRKIREGQYTAPEWVSDNAKDLIDRMLQPNGTLRPSLHRLWSHPWIQEGELESFKEQIVQSQLEIEEEDAELLRIRNRFSEWKGISASSSTNCTDEDNLIFSMVVPYFETSSQDYDENEELGQSQEKIVIETETSDKKSILLPTKTTWFYRLCRKQRLQKNEEPTNVELKTLIVPPRKVLKSWKRKNAGLTVVDEPFSDGIIYKIQLALQSMGIPSQTKGSTVKHGVTSPCKFQFEIIKMQEPFNFFCIKRNYISSKDPKLVQQIIQKVLLISQNQQ